MAKDVVYTSEVETPCGSLLLAVINGKVCLCDWIGSKERGIRALKSKQSIEIVRSDDNPVIKAVIEQLREYFGCYRKHFTVETDPHGTDFQKRVWQALEKIPYGENISYKELAERLGCRNSVRAVANAVGANPISIIIPCHRVVGSDGSLTGYAGGIEKKSFLLDLERVR